MVGETLGHYEILEPLGAGGMGEVYRARDTTLKRDVAIKVLPEEFSADADRLARLEREAHLLAALNHPNIATIHSLEVDDGLRFLVLELVEGESLAQQLAAGPLAVEAALEACKQVAEALEAAHSQGIVHRDLKPANVLVTGDGRAKVLDFGIAKSMEVGAEVAETAKDTDLTVGGTLVGTPSYMSPEQVRGEPVDKRSDVWAFGCVVYEALTGRSPFGRETLADTLAAIVEQPPDWERLPPLHPRVRLLLERCLEKKVRNRYHDIGDVRVDLEVALLDPRGAVAESPTAATTPTDGARPLLLPAALAVVAAIAAGVAAWNLDPRGILMSVRRNENVFLAAEALFETPARNYAVDPTGQRFLMAIPIEQRAHDQIHVLVNWPELLNRQ